MKCDSEQTELLIDSLYLWAQNNSDQKELMRIIHLCIDEILIKRDLLELVEKIEKYTAPWAVNAVETIETLRIAMSNIHYDCRKVLGEGSKIKTKVAPIKWGHPHKANEYHRYNHVVGQTSIGIFLIECREFKNYPPYRVIKSPVPLERTEHKSLKDAKTYCESYWEKSIVGCINA